MTVVVRETSETNIRCELTRGTGRATVATGQPFLDHMLVAFSRYSGLDLTLQAPAGVLAALLGRGHRCSC